MLARGDELPVDFTNRVIYYVGPVDPVGDEAVRLKTQRIDQRLLAVGGPGSGEGHGKCRRDQRCDQGFAHEGDAFIDNRQRDQADK